MASLLGDNCTEVRVTSVLHNNFAESGPQNMTDGDPSTAWYSANERPHVIKIHFRRPVHVHAVTVVFVENRGALSCAVAVPSVPTWTMRPKPALTEPQTFFAPDNVKAVALNLLSIMIPRGSGVSDQVAISLLDVVGVEAHHMPQPAE
ncbi:hypothetical protein GGF31_008937 [Allomyces arbusculus]|nr:hypothetical protein GGF31_008937 [Allomyces arbusculus]